MWPDRESGPGGPLLVISAGVLALQVIPSSPAPATIEAVLSAPRWRQQLARSGPRGEVIEWTPGSRGRMIRRLAELDWSPFTTPGIMPVFVTLTYPGDWLTVAPEGRAVKRHLAALERRWRRAWPGCWYVWKLEFQRRGAPHLHLYAAVWPGLRAGETREVTQVRRRPAVGDGLYFGPWLKAVWADIVAHPDPDERRRHERAGVRVDWGEALRATDPKRIAVYFTKHGQFAAKEYQHQVPVEWQAPGMGPGRFWGVVGLERVAVSVVVTDTERVQLARTLRRWHHAQGITRLVRHGRRRRQVRRRAGRLRYGLGFVCANDAPALAQQLARAVGQAEPSQQEVEHAQGRPLPRRAHGPGGR